MSMCAWWFGVKMYGPPCSTSSVPWIVARTPSMRQRLRACSLAKDQTIGLGTPSRAIVTAVAPIVKSMPRKIWRLIATRIPSSGGIGRDADFGRDLLTVGHGGTRGSSIPSPRARRCQPVVGAADLRASRPSRKLCDRGHSLAVTMDLTVRDLAKLLKVSENTVYRWIEKDDLPAYRLHEQYRLNRVELQEWAAAHAVKLPPELYVAGDSNPPTLSAADERGGIHRAVPGNTRDEVLESVAGLAGIPQTVDRDLLYHLLQSREALSSTGFGAGIAVPHPRNP